MSYPLEPGQMILVSHLEELLSEAKAGQFGDFTSTDYATPKMELVKRLDIIKNNVIEGDYD